MSVLFAASDRNLVGFSGDDIGQIFVDTMPNSLGKGSH
jgi:hypothetical protein